MPEAPGAWTLLHVGDTGQSVHAEERCDTQWDNTTIKKKKIYFCGLRTHVNLPHFLHLKITGNECLPALCVCLFTKMSTLKYIRKDFLWE